MPCEDGHNRWWFGLVIETATRILNASIITRHLSLLPNVLADRLSYRLVLAAGPLCRHFPKIPESARDRIFEHYAMHRM